MEVPVRSERKLGQSNSHRIPVQMLTPMMQASSLLRDAREVFSTMSITSLKPPWRCWTLTCRREGLNTLQPSSVNGSSRITQRNIAPLCQSTYLRELQSMAFYLNLSVAWSLLHPSLSWILGEPGRMTPTSQAMSKMASKRPTVKPIITISWRGIIITKPSFMDGMQGLIERSWTLSARSMVPSMWPREPTASP